MNGINANRRRPLAQAILAAWLAYIAVDFLTHAVFLARWWRATGSFWLPPMQLVRMIPVGYLSFGLYSTGLIWLMLELLGDRPAPSSASVWAGTVGLAVGAIQALANYSVFRMPASALLVWPLSMAVASVAAGAAASSVLRADRPTRRLLVVLAAAVAVVLVGVVLQNTLFPMEGR